MNAATPRVVSGPEFEKFLEEMQRPETDQEKIERLERQVAALTATVPMGYTLEVHDPNGETICVEQMDGWPMRASEVDFTLTNHLRAHVVQHEGERKLVASLAQMTEEEFEANVSMLPPIPELRANLRKLYEQARQPQGHEAADPDGDTAITYL